MNKSCPHCGVSIHESQQICRECDTLFHSNDAPAPPVPVTPPPLQPATVPEIDTAEKPRPLKKVQPLSGIKLIGIALALYCLGRLGTLAIEKDHPFLTLIESGLALVLMSAGIVIFVLGVVRLISGSGAKEPSDDE